MRAPRCATDRCRSSTDHVSRSTVQELRALPPHCCQWRTPFRACAHGAAGGPLPGLRMRRPVLRPGSPAMLGLVTPSQNSLRELRSLRSNNCDETEHEARCARGPRALRFSASHRRPGSGPPAALSGLGAWRRRKLRSRREPAVLRRAERHHDDPAEEGGEANPGSEGGARSTDWAQDMEGFASPSSSARAALGRSGQVKPESRGARGSDRHGRPAAHRSRCLRPALPSECRAG